MIPIFKNKADIRECDNYRESKLMSHTKKLWDRAIERRIREKVTYSNEQFGFMRGRNSTDAVFALH